MRAAVIGIGSNSVRSLLADVNGADYKRLWRDREGTRLFAGLDADGNLNRESMDKTVSAVRRMASELRRQGAEKLAIFATSAARDAANGQAFMAEVEREAGVPLRIISGEEEAELSFLGASAAVDADRAGMIDIGGGSTEIAIGTRAGIECAFSCQMGAVRLYRRLRIDRKEDMKPVEDRIHLQGMQPSRADIVVHGICILLGVMERLGIGRITVSEWGNLDGYFHRFFCNS